MAAWGVEARVPFLDLEFLDLAMTIDAEHKRVKPGGMEKAILREAFDGVLPDAIRLRQKEQFSDGVGYGWIDSLRAWANAQVSDEALALDAERSEEHTSELQSLMRISYAVSCLKKKNT